MKAVKFLVLLVILVAVAAGIYVYFNSDATPPDNRGSIQSTESSKPAPSKPAPAKDKPRVEEKYGISTEAAGG